MWNISVLNSFLWLDNILFYGCANILVFCWWIFGLFPSLFYCEKWCYKHSYAFFNFCFKFFLVYTQKWTSCLMSILCLIYFRWCFLQWLKHFIWPPAVCKSFHILCNTCLYFWKYLHPSGYVVVSYDITLHFLMTITTEHLFMCLFAHCVSSLEEHLLKSFACFLKILVGSSFENFSVIFFFLWSVF